MASDNARYWIIITNEFPFSGEFDYAAEKYGIDMDLMETIPTEFEDSIYEDD